MATYLVDFENVKQGGLTGIEVLKQDDVVAIFYSDDNDSIPLRMLEKTSARIEYRRVITGCDSALDFQFVAYLFHELKPDEEYYIISRDRGYDMVVPMAFSFGNAIIRKSFIGEDDSVWENSFEYRSVLYKSALLEKKDINEKIHNVCGLYGITDPCIVARMENPDTHDLMFVNKPVQEKIAMMIKEKVGNIPTAETVRLLIDGLARCENKQEFYTFCRRNLGEATGHQFYKSIRGSFEEMAQAVRFAS